MKILITGASGGLGSVLAVLALERGHQVYAAGRSREKVEKALESVRTKGYQGYREFRESRALRILPLDVTSEADAKACARTVQEDGGALDGLVNCAAIMIEREKTLEDLDLNRVVESFQVNTVGPMRMVQHLLPCLYRGEKASVINISSEAGTIINAYPSNYAYSMSKTALNMFSERLREAMREKDILVYSVHPGWMRTNMGGTDAPADPEDIANGILDLMERKKRSYSKISFIDATGRPMPL